MARTVGIGIQSFEKLITENSFYIDKTDFIKCHRSYICRVRAIFRIDKVSVYFDDGSNIPVSRRMYEKVNQAFIQCFSKVSSV